VVFTFGTSLQSIVISNAVKVIDTWAFFSCLGLNTVIFGDGLEKID
jgi:hypothetical protein